MLMRDIAARGLDTTLAKLLELIVATKLDASCSFLFLHCIILNNESNYLTSKGFEHAVEIHSCKMPYNQSH